MKTLILDDDPIFLTVATGVLKHLGSPDVTATVDPHRALNLVSNHGIDLVILDLNMPGHDGFDFLRDLANAAYAGSLIVASGEQESVLSSAKQIARRLKMKVIGTLSKPVTIDALSLLVDEAKVRASASPLIQPQDQRAELSDVAPSLVYQIQVNTFTHTVNGTEALLRAVDKSGNLSGPTSLLAAADTPETAFDLTRQLLDLFCREVGQLHAAGCRWPFSFNVDARPMENPDFVTLAQSTCARHGLRPSHVVFELTESHLPSDPSALLSGVARLRMAGFELAMDDFSTGASSFDMLRDGAFSEVKLDMDLTRSAMEFEASRAFIRNLVNIAQDLGLRLVAEGIETDAEASLMKALGVRHMQGFLFGKPAPADQLAAVASAFMGEKVS
ncbi:MAG: EAL domain-containing response regulator [Pseudomonadota bacterium]